MTRQPLRALTWFDILGYPECTHCARRLPPADHGLRRAFCPLCTVDLPDAVALHLDRAMRSRWFVAWWRQAAGLLRAGVKPVRRDVSCAGETRMAGLGRAAGGGL